MRKPVYLLISAILISGFLTACYGQIPKLVSALVPSETQLPTETPTSTPTPYKSPQPTPTSTPIPVPTFELGEVQAVPFGGFSYRPISGYVDEPFQNALFLFNKQESLFIMLSGGDWGVPLNGNPYYKSKTAVEENLLAFTSQDERVLLELGESHPIIIDEIEGTVFDLSGSMYEVPVQGQAFAVWPTKSQFLFGMAIQNLDKESMPWDTTGAPVFSALMGTIQFIEVQALDESACEVSSDYTYGYTEDNPIKVGGGAWDGPGREEVYLNSLVTSDGLSIGFERLGSEEYGDTILDIYQVTNGNVGESVILYIDEYSFETPIAPAGFVCWRAIELSEP